MKFLVMMLVLWLFSSTPNIAYSFEFSSSTESYETKEYARTSFLTDRDLDAHSHNTKQSAFLSIPLANNSFDVKLDRIHWVQRDGTKNSLVDYRADQKTAAWRVTSGKMDFTLMALSEEATADLGSYDRVDQEIEGNFLMGMEVYFEANGTFVKISQIPRFKHVTLAGEKFATLNIKKSTYEAGWKKNNSQYYRFFGDADNLYVSDDITPYSNGSGFIYENRKPEMPQVGKHWKLFSWGLSQKLKDDVRLVDFEVKNKISLFTGGIQHFLTHQFFIRNYREIQVFDETSWVTENFAKGEMSQAITLEGVENLENSPANLGWKFYYKHDPIMDTLQTIGINLNLSIIF